MSSFSKLLLPITVPSGGWAFSWNEGASNYIKTLTAGTYETILDLANDLRTLMLTIPTATTTLSVDPDTAKFSITRASLTSIEWASCDSDLLDLLGFDQTETPSGNVVTANDQHLWGWYPGLITHGDNDGSGPSADSYWIAEDNTSRQYSGSGKARIISSARKIYKRSLTFTPLNKSEVILSRGKGPKDFEDRWISKKIYFYPDRDNGEVGDLGTQLDPGAYEVDTDGDYYIVTLAKNPVINSTGSHPDWFSVRIEMTVESK